MRYARAMRDRESGFTLIEMLVTMAVVAILAVIALPSFFSESRKTKAFSEVQPMFNDLRVRLEQFLQENGRYPPNLGETTLHPSTAPSITRQPLNPLPTAWQDLKVRISGPDEVFCGYTWVTGLANDASNIGPQAGALVPPFTAPTTDWYYLLAKCDMDGDGTTFSFYFASSVDPTIRKINEGS